MKVKSQLIKDYKILLEDTINKRIETDNPFIIGRMHNLTGNNLNHPYFSEYQPVSGSLDFKNKTYKLDGLQYDIKNDKLVYRYFTSTFELNCIALDEKFIPQFSIYNTTFRYFQGLETKFGRKLKDGYYEVVHDGKKKFLVRWEKTESFDVNVPYKFNDSKNMFLLKDGLVVNIKSKGQLLAQFKDKKQDVKRFIKYNSIVLRLKDYSSITQVLKYYESLF